MKKLLILTTLFSGLLLSSCLKDKAYDAKEYGTQGTDATKLITFLNAKNLPTATASKDSISLTASISSQVASQVLSDINLTLESAEASASDVNVNIAVNSIPVPVGYKAFAAAEVSLPAAIKIPAGTRQVKVPVTFPNASLLDPTKVYALSLTITGADNGYGPAGNRKNIIIAYSIKNIYEGTYTVVSGNVTRYTSPGVPANDPISGPVGGNPDLVLSTINANTCEITNLKWSGGVSGVAGIDNLRVSVDPTTNLVTMQALGNGTLTNWAGKINNYDPVNKVFKIAMRWNPTANVREYEMVIKRK
jgi:Domain of unknown function (DUF1735)